MIHTEEKKQEYWDHFLASKKYWPNGFTVKRLEKIKDVVWQDQDFWDDILLRHSGYDFTPRNLKMSKPVIYDHCIGNFSGMLLNIMVKHKIIKP